MRKKSCFRATTLLLRFNSLSKKLLFVPLLLLLLFFLLFLFFFLHPFFFFSVPLLPSGAPPPPAPPRLRLMTYITFPVRGGAAASRVAVCNIKRGVNDWKQRGRSSRWRRHGNESGAPSRGWGGGWGGGASRGTGRRLNSAAEGLCHRRRRHGNTCRECEARRLSFSQFVPSHTKTQPALRWDRRRTGFNQTPPPPPGVHK